MLFYFYLTGTGFALMYVSSVVVVGLYFDRRRALAVGVASSGSGIGIFVIAAATGALLKVMSWRSISQIEAALMVLGIISGLTLRPLPKDVSEIEENAEKSKWKIFIDRLDIKLFKILAFDLICCVFILGTTGKLFRKQMQREESQGKKIHYLIYVSPVIGIVVSMI